ncbi:MAG: restriction endonuclease subunit S [Clostridia bacterium]|nr:restriction endonuclease subunit S [Clostridia bacterium]
MKVTLGEIATLINGDRGKNYPSQEDISSSGEVPFVNAGHLNGREIEFSDMNYISLEKYNSLNSGKFTTGDILYCLRGSLGKKAIVGDEVKGAIASSLVIIRPNPTFIKSEYLMLALDSSDIHEQLAMANNGSSQPNLSAASIRNFSIDLPDLTEQTEITQILQKVRSTIDAYTQQLLALDTLIKARFIEMFGGGKYRTVKAAEVCDFITKGTTPPTDEIVFEYETGLIPFLKVYNLSFTGELLFDAEPQYIPATIHNGKLARSKVYPNDVLMNIVGPPLGKFSLVTNEFAEWNINQAIAIFRSQNDVLPRYLLAALMQPKVLGPFVEQAVGIRQLNLSLEQCRNLEFPLPPIAEQVRFVEFSAQVDKSKVVVQKALDEAQLLFDSLMQKYFG